MISVASNDFESAIERATCLQREHDFIGAAAIFSWLAENSVEPNAVARFLFCAASCYAQSGDLDRARSFITKAQRLAITDNEVDTLVGLGVGSIHFAAGEYSEAARSLETTLNRKSELLQLPSYSWLRSEIQQRLGFALFKLERLSDARSILEGVLDTCDDPTDVLIYLARICKSLGDRNGAESKLRHALERSPDSAWVVFELGCLYLEAKQYPKATEFFERCKTARRDWTLSNDQVELKLAAALQRSR